MQQEKGEFQRLERVNQTRMNDVAANCVTNEPLGVMPTGVIGFVEEGKALVFRTWDKSQTQTIVYSPAGNITQIRIVGQFGDREKLYLLDMTS